MSKNGLANYGKAANYVNLVHMPTPKQEYTQTFQNMDGGLNTYDLPVMLPPDESPDMLNMQWLDGALSCRLGQEWRDFTVNSKNAPVPNVRGAGHAAYEELFWGYIVYHAGTSLWCYDVEGEDPDLYTNPQQSTELLDLSTIATHSRTGAERGTFLRYGDYLFYKAPGVYVRIKYENDGLTAENVCSIAYAPITHINCDALTGSGDSYQPENRLSPEKILWYNAATTDVVETHTTTTALNYTFSTPAVSAVDMVYLDGVLLVERVEYFVNLTSQRIELVSAPTAGQALVCHVKKAAVDYYLPVKDANTTITELLACMDSTLTFSELSGLVVQSDPSSWSSAWDAYDYVFYPPTGHILFKTAAYVSFPTTNNTVQIKYSLANSDAFKAIMDCRYGIAYGGTQDLCIVLGGCEAQTNAYFWNGNNAAMDPTYFPMDQYNLAGNTEEHVTGFGKQQAMLVIFTDKSIGRSSLGTQTINDRVYITFDYVPINARIGCDLPWTIQLIENNLVFCNRQQGLHFVNDSSAAYENNVIGISRKVNGTQSRVGIIDKVREAENDRVVAFDDDKRYWLVIDDEVYMWDYELSDQKNPSFFFFNNICARAFVKQSGELWHVDKSGRLTLMARTYSDYGEAIHKLYVFPPQFFGTFDRLKDVTVVIFALKSSTSTHIKLTYNTDWETRDDLTDIDTSYWRLWPRNLDYRTLNASGTAHVARRRPGCRHIRHFGMRLENNDKGLDMGVIYAQIFYKFQGRDR